MTTYWYRAALLALLTPAACSSDEKRPISPLPAPAPTAQPASPPPPAEAVTEKRTDVTSLWLDPSIASACGIRAPQSFFEFDPTYGQSPDRQRTLNTLAACLSTGALKGRTLRLVGHSDPVGPGGHDKPFDRARADAVATYLMNMGVERSKISTDAPREETVMGVDQWGWSYERRVDIRLGKLAPAPAPSPAPSRVARPNAELDRASAPLPTRPKGRTPSPARPPMTFALANNWWTFASRGALAALFGLLTVAMPELTLATFVLLFGWYAFVEGGINLLGAIRASARRDPWWPLLLEGAVSVGAGLLLFFQPDFSWRALLSLVAFWALTTGALELIASARLRERIEGEWLLASAGVVSVGLGGLLELAPALDPLKIVFWLGAYALCFGGTLIALGMRLRGYVVDHEHTTLGPPLASPLRYEFSILRRRRARQKQRRR